MGAQEAGNRRKMISTGGERVRMPLYISKSKMRKYLEIVRVGPT